MGHPLPLDREMRLPETSQPEPRLQVGALPYRCGASGDLQVLLVTSRRTRRWIIPKGWPIAGMGPAGSAAREAFEEAGVIGSIDSEAVGSFRYRKERGNKGPAVMCEVAVFPLRVEQELTAWPEIGERELRWMASDDAADLVSDAGLGDIIRRAVRQVIG